MAWATELATSGSRDVPSWIVFKKDLYAGSRLIEKACENGQVNACKTLGELYLTGKGLEVNYSKANYYVGKACDADDFEACAVLGTMHARAMGVRRNLDRAKELFTKSCDGQNGYGCLLLGKMYNSGFGVKLDPTKALNLFEKSCSLGLEDGCKEKQEKIGEAKTKITKTKAKLKQ